MSYPFGDNDIRYRTPQQNEPTLWLSTPTGQRFAKRIAGLRTAEVEFATDSEQMPTSEAQDIKGNRPLAEANAVSSWWERPEFQRGSSHTNATKSRLHKPVLDLDISAMLVPSSTSGHFHLYLDKVLPWSDYEKLLKVLKEVGIIEPGYAHACIARQETWVRLPWVRKGSNDVGPFA